MSEMSDLIPLAIFLPWIVLLFLKVEVVRRERERAALKELLEEVQSLSSSLDAAAANLRALKARNMIKIVRR